MKYSVLFSLDYAEHDGYCSGSTNNEEGEKHYRAVIEGPDDAVDEDGEVNVRALYLKDWTGKFGCGAGSGYCDAYHNVVALSADVAGEDEELTPTPRQSGWPRDQWWCTKGCV